MSLTEITKDPDTLTMTITAHFDASVDRVWQIWADPRQLERWWGPPTWPATVEEHDLRAGGRVAYFMTGPEGERARGYWDVVAVEAPHRLTVDDGFADEHGSPDPSMPTTRMQVEIADDGAAGTRMVLASTFPSAEAMEQMVAMGMEEGIALAIGQIDAVLQPAA
jgi:uncharacterized protein YndB with AHSA1/START domain